MKGLSFKSVRVATLIFAAMLSLVFAAEAGDVSGVIDFDGPRPKRRAIKMEADAKCEAMHSKPVGSQGVIVSKALKVRNAFVYIKSGLGDTKYDAPAEPVKLNQKGCMYSPHVIGMMAGQGIKIINNDNTLHNIHSLAKKNRAFNFGQPVPGERIEKMPRAEKGIKIKCDVHPWMSSFVHVMKHPFFDVTNSKGVFKIEGLPPGEYEIAVWHEKFDEVTAKITVGDGGLDGVVLKLKP